jgi:hypothetical protein
MNCLNELINRIIPVIFLLFSFSLYAQSSNIEVTKLNKEELPQEIKIPGKIIEAMTWIDKNGKNYFIQYVGEDIRQDFEDHESFYKKEIFACQYVEKNEKIDSLWGFEYKRGCGNSLELKFIPNSVYVTDLDSNGVTETTFFYKTACRSDMSPADIELIMHENKNKYTLKGTSFISYSSIHEKIDLDNYEFNLETALGKKLYNDVFSGRFVHAHDFDNAPKQFIKFAIEKWRVHVKEHY